MPELILSPTDTLFFKDGKPFSMGDDTAAQGVFPPYPSVYYGALRASWLYRNPDKLEELTGECTPRAYEKDDDSRKRWEETKQQDPTRKLAIQGSGLCALEGKQAHRLWPIPLDLIQIPNSDPPRVQALKRTIPKHLEGSNLHPELLTNPQPEGKVSSLDGKAFLREKDYQSYLKGEIHEAGLAYVSLDLEAMREDKIGVGLENATWAAKEGHLYRVQMVRPSTTQEGNHQQYGFWVRYAGMDDLMGNETDGFMKLGAEGKTVRYHQKDAGQAAGFFPKPTLEHPWLKLILASPAIFRQGSMPGQFEQSTLNWEVEEQTFKAQLRALTVGKPLYAGGWDIRARKPKPMYRAVPAGSTYYLHFDELKQARQFVDATHGQCISHFRSHEGYGLAFCAPLSPFKEDAQS